MKSGKTIIIVILAMCVSFTAGMHYEKSRMKKPATQLAGAKQPVRAKAIRMPSNPGFKGLENLALSANVQAEGSDIPVRFINDGDYSTRWNAEDDDTDTWIEFKWDTPRKINRLHVTEYRSRIRGHSVVYDETQSEVERLVMTPEKADASSNHPDNQPIPTKIPDHVLTFQTVDTAVLRYKITATSGERDEPTIWEVEIYHDPEAR